MGKDLQRRESVAVSLVDRWDPDQVALIKDTVARGASNAQLALFLNICARYELDPLAKQIYMMTIKRKDGEDTKQMVPVVGRDGFLVIANRSGDFLGMTGDCVYSGDEYVKRETPDGPVVEHTVTTADPEKRGKLLGAWAIVYREGRRPTYFYARVEQYKPTGNKLEFSPWGTQEDVMMLKCAQSNALRLAYSITGLFPAEEGSIAIEDPGGSQVPEVSIDWGEDEEMAGDLARLFALANELSPDAYRPAKIAMLLQGATPDRRSEIAGELREFVVRHGGNPDEEPAVDAEFRVLGDDEAAPGPES